MLRATKVRGYPTPEQAEFRNRQFGAVRFVWNKALAIRRHRYRGAKLSAKPLSALQAQAQVASELSLHRQDQGRR